MSLKKGEYFLLMYQVDCYFSENQTNSLKVIIPLPSWSMMPTSSFIKDYYQETYIPWHSPTLISVSDAFHPKSVMTWGVHLISPIALYPGWYDLGQVGSCDGAVTTDIKQSEHLLARTSSHPSSHSSPGAMWKIVSLSILHVSWMMSDDGSL